MTITDILLRLFLSLIIGGAIGLERENKRLPAGFRTYMLVCLSSTLVMMTGYHITLSHTGDPSRLAAQLISGIGFLGVGTIIFTHKNKVKGLTTAAGLLITACIGIAIGSGFYLASIIVGVIVILVMNLFGLVNKFVYRNSKQTQLFIYLKSMSYLDKIRQVCNEMGISIKHIEFIENNNDNISINLVLYDENKKQSKQEIRTRIENLEGVYYVEKI